MQNPFELIENQLKDLNTQLSEIRQELNSKSQTNTEEVFTVEMAASFLNLTINTIYKKAKLLELTSHPRAGCLYFLKSELTDWVKEAKKISRREIDEQTDRYLAQVKKIRGN